VIEIRGPLAGEFYKDFAKHRGTWIKADGESIVSVKMFSPAEQAKVAKYCFFRFDLDCRSSPVNKSSMPNGIREVTTTKNKRGDYESVRLVFGPHYFVQLKLEDLGAVTFVLGATHHGFKADASQVNGELYATT
jgi:hypothetical protein